MAFCDETYTFHSSANKQILPVETVTKNKLWFFGSNLSHKYELAPEGGSHNTNPYRAIPQHDTSSIFQSP